MAVQEPAVTDAHTFGNAHYTAQHPRNPGMELELDWLRGVQVNRSAAERRAATLGVRTSLRMFYVSALRLQASSLRYTASTGVQREFKVTTYEHHPRR